MNTHNSCGLCKIKIEGLTVKSGRDVLIENINLEFACGELTALIGKNGAGKTTLLRAILGDRNYEGNVSFIHHDGVKTVKPVIGYVPQHLIFDKSTPVSVLDFMCAGKYKRPLWTGVSKSAYNDVYKKLSAFECEHVINRKLGELSGGELQRVLLAMALDPIPDLLILDEPASGIDVSGLDLFYKTVSELRNKYHMSIILVSHDLGLIKKYADNAVLIDKTVIKKGSVKEVFESTEFKTAFGINLEA